MRNIQIAKDGLKISKKSATIKLEWINRLDENEIKALAILLGGYDEYGKGIDLQKHRSNVFAFSVMLDSIVKELTT